MKPKSKRGSPAARGGRRARGGKAIGDHVAAVDLGSNSFHLIVARVTAGEVQVLDRLREMVRLASGLDRSRNLSTDAQNRALECLQRFGQRVRHLPPRAVRAVGTNTLRSAHNAAEFVDRAENALGHPIDTISGIEEARLIYLGVSRSLPERGVRRLVVDIGGGSTEVIVGEAERPLAMDSLYLGCVSMSRDHFRQDVIDSASWEGAEIAALREFEPIQARYRKLGWQEAIGASGTIRAVNEVVRAAGWSERGITLAALRKLRGALLEAGRVDRIKLEGLSSERRPVFAGGVAALLGAFEALGIELMEVADGALREGLLYDLLGRIRHEDVRDASVKALGERYHVDWAQAARVESTAAGLLAQAAEDWGLANGESDRLLGWGARLHEIGLDIAHASYHKHGEYIVAQSDLMGFSRGEQRLLATLVRGHRRKFPLAAIKLVPKERRATLGRLCVLLRLAAVLHRSREPEPAPPLELSLSARRVRLRFPKGWLDQHPLTRDDLRQEKTFLKSAGFRMEVE